MDNINLEIIDKNERLSSELINRHKEKAQEYIRDPRFKNDLLFLLKKANVKQIKQLPIKEYKGFLKQLYLSKELDFDLKKKQEVERLLKWEDKKQGIKNKLYDNRHYFYVLASVIVLSMIATVLYLIIHFGYNSEWKYIIDVFGFALIGVVTAIATFVLVQSAILIYDKRKTKESEFSNINN